MLDAQPKKKKKRRITSLSEDKNKNTAFAGIRKVETPLLAIGAAVELIGAKRFSRV